MMASESTQLYLSAGSQSTIQPLCQFVLMSDIVKRCMLCILYTLMVIEYILDTGDGPMVKDGGPLYVW